MDLIKEAFTRMNLQQLQHFLLYGTEELDREKQPYSDRLEKESEPIQKRLESLYPIQSQMDEAAAELSQALISFEEVYMEIGMKARARLILHLLIEDA